MVKVYVELKKEKERKTSTSKLMKKWLSATTKIKLINRLGFKVKKFRVKDIQPFLKK